MTEPRLLHTLRARILIAVVVCAVLPLAATGAWLTSTAARSGELLLRSQLDSATEHAAGLARERWTHRQSDALLLAGNAPIREALALPSPPATPPDFVRRAFESMPNITGAIVRDRNGASRWTFGDISPGLQSRTSGQQPGTPAPSPNLVIHAPIRSDSGNTILGEVVAFVRVEDLVPSSTSPQGTGTEFIAIHLRVDGGWVRPATLPASLLDTDHFMWEGHRWLGVRRSLEAPEIDIVAAGQLDPFVQPFARTARVGATALALVAVAVVALTIVVAGRLTGSLTTLAVAADAVSQGDLETRIDDGSRDEVGRVARAFNVMTANLRRMMSERSQQEAVAAMGELAATVAHQVRSPATAVRLDVQRAHDKLPSASTERALLARALEQLDRMDRAISGSLKVARGAASFRAIDVREPLRRAIAGAEHEHVASGVRIDSSAIASDSLPVFGDAASLEQLFSNVLANAIQVSSGDGQVVVRAMSVERGRLRVEIRDRGAGMSEEVLHRAGEAFFSTRSEGTGLGLAIATRIATAHRGTLTIDSMPGAGTTVNIELPSATTGA